jgi:hypothetical protein
VVDLHVGVVSFTNNIELSVILGHLAVLLG